MTQRLPADLGHGSWLLGLDPLGQLCHRRDQCHRIVVGGGHQGRSGPQDTTPAAQVERDDGTARRAPWSGALAA